jgi:hypothetical protein
MNESGETTEKTLLKRLNQCPVVEVVGVVDANGASGGSYSSGDDLWTLSLCLAAWKYPGRSLQRTKLTVRKKVPESEIGSLDLNPYDVVALKVRIAEQNVFGTPQALLVEIIGKLDGDEELNQCVAELMKPVSFAEPTFGTFTLDRRLNWFETQTEWNGVAIKLTLDIDNWQDSETILTSARTLWGSQGEWEGRCKDKAVDRLLELKNSSWLDDQESELSAEQFKAKMILESILLHPDGSFEFWYDDGDLFWGHAIMVEGDLEEGPRNAHMEG